ncbi:MAG: precorrin-6A/cobalt-precorrin-6A reductase [Hyphomicrobiaceae bacterium]|jgi:precorrin-6A/cobalt-precorrin-6A reductase
MNHNLLILGGTTEASQLARAVADQGIAATLSYAGRVERPRPQPVDQRVGGFGGIAGLIAYIKAEQISHVIDATHPFAEQMSRNAVAACDATGIPLIALTRPPWQATKADQWRNVADMSAAVASLSGTPQRVMLAVGRLHLERFADQPQHHYILRLVDPPATPPPMPHHSVIISRGPFDVASDTELMRAHDVELIVSKNAGGTGAIAKLHAARALRIPVIMIARPALPSRREAYSIDEVFSWLGHDGTDLGV